jgi:ribosome-associated toxin RatA of RatAB toxin-antitoxin module
MPEYNACRSALIPARPQACFDALTAFEELPRWQSAVKEVRVLERDDRGRGRVVEYVVDARVTRVRYRLEQLYEEPGLIGSRYLGGDFADMHGEWRLDARPDGVTCAAFDLSIDPGRAVPGPVRRMVANVVVRGALKDLERHLTPPG